MSKIRYIDFSPDEWIAAVAGMPADMQGVYWLICSLIYSSGGPIRDDDPRLHTLCGCHGRSLNAIIKKLENSGKIIRNGAEIDQKRCRKELEKAVNRSAKASENGAKGGRPRNENKDIEKPDGSDEKKPSRGRTINYQPSTTNQESPKPPSGALARRELFDAWWQTYPHKVGKSAAEAKYRIALARASPAELLAGVNRYIASKPPDRPWCNPATWLHQARWLDQPAPLAAVNGSNGARYDPAEREIQTAIARAKRLRDSGDPAWTYATDAMIEKSIRAETTQ